MIGERYSTDVTSNNRTASFALFVAVPFRRPGLQPSACIKNPAVKSTARCHK